LGNSARRTLGKIDVRAHVSSVESKPMRAAMRRKYEMRDMKDETETHAF
jgi:hypothetical protein